MIALKPYAWLDLSGSYPNIKFAVYTSNGTTNHQIKFLTSGFDSTDPDLYCYNYSCEPTTTTATVFTGNGNNAASAGAKRIAVRLFNTAGSLIGSITLTVDSNLFSTGYQNVVPYCYLQTTITPRLKLWITSPFTNYNIHDIYVSGNVLMVEIYVNSRTMVSGGGIDPNGCDPIDLSTFDITTFTHISVVLTDPSQSTAKSHKGKGTTTQSDSDSSGAD